MNFYRCDTSNRDVKFRKSKLFVQCPELESSFAALEDAGVFTLPLREGDPAGSLFDFVYSVGYVLESLSVMNDVHWPRMEIAFLVGMFGALSKLGFKIFPPTLSGGEKTLVTQGLPAPCEKRIKVPLDEQIFAYSAFVFVQTEWNLDLK